MMCYIHKAETLGSQLTSATSIGHHGGRVITLLAYKTVIGHGALEAVSRALATVTIVDLVCLHAFPADHHVCALVTAARATVEWTL